ncbi:MAG TPA: aminotransferase class V-fold PLP-dependent enzyme [Longimicrobiaceae bacterium]|nr:aminotransferase class V-fold PLP-dependent enzyme [Longimicrobiaceae bacterium]
MAGDVYLDYAATSAIRPECVTEAIVAYLRDVGATPGRAGHRRALDAGRLAFRARRALVELFGAPGDPGRIAFQPNATYALNAALHGLLRPGDRLVRTQYDHNAVRRPAAALAARGVHEVVLTGSPDGTLDMDELESALSGDGKPARILVFPHVSNVLGTALPVAEMAERAHARGTLVLVDAAQSAGHLPIDVQAMGIDLLAFTGHKGLLGPQGTGGLWVREGIDVAPVISGGTGAESADAEMPAAMPDRLEAGTQNAPGIAGLLAGVEFLRGRGVDALHVREMRLKARLRDRLAAIPRVHVHSPAAPDGVGIVTVTADGIDPAELALRLDREHAVLTRAGLHCAPEAHRILGTARTGAVRFSVGWATTDEDVERAGDAMQAICSGETTPRRAG